MKIFLAILSLAVLLLSAARAGAAINAMLSWQDNSTNEDGFAVERGNASSGPFVEIGRVAANLSGYLDPNLAEVTTYCYRVRAFTSAGFSGYSNVACLTTVRLPPDGAPANLVVQIATTPP